MNLSKSESLFLYSLLFQISGSDWDPATKEQISSMMSNIEVFLTGEESTCRPSQVQDEEDEEDDEDGEELEAQDQVEDEDIKHHFLIAPSDLQELPAQNARNFMGDKVTIQFEDVDTDDSIDVLVNEGSVLLPEVSSIKITEKSINFHDGDEWHSFPYKRLSKAWSNVFKLDYVYGVGATT